ncbi:MAG: GNAT family N-acetyltransferase [Rhizobium sp.]
MPRALPLSDTVPDATRETILAGIKAHNNAMLGPTDRRDIFIPLRDDEGKTVGGLVGYTGRGWLYVEMLFVPEHLRGRGLAGALLQRAEDEARARGCTGAYIDTINPQARRAYERQGYEIFGTLDHFTGDFSITWLKKKL